MAGRCLDTKQKIPCPKCGNRVQWDGMKWHNRSKHQGARRRVHVCSFDAEKTAPWPRRQEVVDVEEPRAGCSEWGSVLAPVAATEERQSLLGGEGAEMQPQDLKLGPDDALLGTPEPQHDVPGQGRESPTPQPHLSRVQRRCSRSGRRPAGHWAPHPPLPESPWDHVNPGVVQGFQVPAKVGQGDDPYLDRIHPWA